MKLNVTITEVQRREVDVSPGEFAHVLLVRLKVQLQPREVAKYDDWYIDDFGHIIGVTEYHHGSDSYTSLGPADTELLENYRAIHRVAKLLENIK